MNEFKGTKEEKALRHAKKVWGIYFDDVDEDCNSTRGENSQKDYLAGYNQALEDTHAPQMLEMLKEIITHADSIIKKDDNSEASETYYQVINRAEKLIQQATTIK